MHQKYYTHFLVTEFDGQGFGEFTGVVELSRQTRNRLCPDDVRDLLADNLEVDVDEVHVIQWSRLH